MRTPGRVRANAWASRMCRVASVKRRVQRDHLGARQQVVELDLLDAEVPRAVGREEGVVGDHAHLQAMRAVGDDRADVAAADQAQHLVGELGADEARFLPFAGARRAVGGGQLAGERHHHRDRVLGGGDRVAERRVHHDDAALGGGGEVDVVDPDAGAADHLEALGSGEHRSRDLGRRAHREAVVFADDPHQLALSEAGTDVGRDATLLEGRDRGRAQGVGDQHSRHLTSPRRGAGRRRPSRARAAAPRGRPPRRSPRPRAAAPAARRDGRRCRRPRPPRRGARSGL